MEELLTTPNENTGIPGARWWKSPGSLLTCLLRLDGAVGAVVNAEKHLANPAVVFGEVAGELGRLVQQIGLGAGDGVVEQSDKAPTFGPVKPDFTREAGSIRQWVGDR